MAIFGPGRRSATADPRPSFLSDRDMVGEDGDSEKRSESVGVAITVAMANTIRPTQDTTLMAGERG